MYLRRLHVKGVKLLRDVSVDFVDGRGQPRMWTVFVGENRLCKTTLLQTIAAAAAGRDRGTQLVTDVIASWPDLRDPRTLEIDAHFGFSAERNHARTYPGKRPSADRPPVLTSRLSLDPNNRVFEGQSSYEGVTGDQDPLAQARRDSLADWFVAGYGPSRLLPSPGKAARQIDPTVDRMRPLFGEPLVGTGFVELLGEDLGRAYAKVLQTVLVGGELLPHINALELRGRGGIRSAKDLVEAQRFEMDLKDKNGERIRVPATWLSQGYQSLIAWLADVVGQIFLEAGSSVEAEFMEGIILIDEIDLHLHPTWQVRLVPALKAVFPRLQFIATTHSPMVLPGLTAEEVFILSQDDNGDVHAQASTQSPMLLTGSELFSAFFEINKLYPGVLGEKLRRYGNFATDPTRSAEDDVEMQNLRVDLEAAGVAFDWEPVAREAAE